MRESFDDLLDDPAMRLLQTSSALARRLTRVDGRALARLPAQKTQLLAARGLSGSSGLSGGALEAEAETPADPASLDWGQLGFDYVPTKSIALFEYSEDKGWDAGRLQGPMLNLHIASNALHYGQAIFEGLKVFRTKQGDVSAFNPLANCARLNRGCRRLLMPAVPEDVFMAGLESAIKDNAAYVPPYGSGGALYARPMLFGHGAKLGLGPAPKYSFAVMVSPVGAYYKGGKMSPLDALVIDDYDRAAPRGMGAVKAAGNYAADTLPAHEAKERGFPIGLYLDCVEHKYIEEFSTSNLVGISKDGSTFVTPKTPSILPSITNEMLQKLALDRGMKVEQRAVEVTELADFSEVACCGTAVVLGPLKSVTHGKTKYTFDHFDTLQKLYDDFTAVQNGDAPDKHGFHHTIIPAAAAAA